jgi:hypothetical protein
MILDLEEHELSNSLKSLETIFKQLNITPVYLNITRDEYLRAMDWRRQETINVFNNFDISVLKSSDCAFIQTALRRGCINGEDVDRMFTGLMEMPSIFSEDLPIINYDYAELSDFIEVGETNPEVKTQINDTYKKRAGRDKREKPLIHDTGMICGAQFIRKDEKCWIITSDSTMKRYAIEHCIRDENEIAIGLDVVIALMAVNSGGVNMSASNFAPLFKNLIKYSLVPESDAFEVKDLAFILRTNIRVNELPHDKVIEVAKEVKRLRVAGEEEENVALYLRRFMEGDAIGMVKEVEEAHSKESLAVTRSEQAERERDIIIDEYRNRRKGEHRDKYDTELRNNRIKIVGIPTLVGVIVFITIKFGFNDTKGFTQYLIGCSVELIFGILPLIPLNKKLLRKHSEYVNDINRIVENEILEMKKKAR